MRGVSLLEMRPNRWFLTKSIVVRSSPRSFSVSKMVYALAVRLRIDSANAVGPAVWLGPTCVVRENVVRRAASKVFATEPEQVGSRQSRDRPSGVAPGRPLLSPPGGGPYGDITLLRIFRVQL